MKRILIFFMLVISIIFLPAFLISCEEKDGSDYIFRYDIETNPGNLDPQSANDIASELIIRNIFEGLLKTEENGSLTEGIATDYTVSEDGLTYTFNLRKDAYWTDVNGYEANCTAEDFVFAFRRLFMPETRAPKASEFYCIKNSRLINQKQISDINELGVYADDKYTLTFALDYPNPLFTTLLTTPPAMPCNEEYFYKTKGAYGLNSEATPSNGAFYLSKWNYDKWSDENNHLILKRNNKNSEIDKVYPTGVNFFINKKTDFYKRFTESRTDCFVTFGEEAQELIASGYSYTEYNNSVWGIGFNKKSRIFSDDDLCEALSLSVDYDALNRAFSKNVASAIIPGGITLLDKSYREYADLDNDFRASHNVKRAKELFDGWVNDNKSIDLYNVKIIMPGDDRLKEYFSYIQQIWQKELGFFGAVEILSPAGYNNALQNGNFDFVLMEISGNYNSPEAFLSKFKKDSTYNYLSYNNQEFEEILNNAVTAVTMTESAEYYKQAEMKLLQSNIFIPLYYQSEFFFMGNGCLDVSYNPFTKSLIFSEGKYFK